MYKNHTHMEESRDFLFCHVTDRGRARDLRKPYVIKNTEIGYSRNHYYVTENTEIGYSRIF